MKKHKTFARRITNTVLLAGTCVLSANSTVHAQDGLPPIVAGYSQQLPVSSFEVPASYVPNAGVPGQLMAAPLAAAPMPNVMMSGDSMPTEMLAPTTQFASHALGQHHQGNACYDPCCLPWWAHRTGFFGEVLYLAPGNSDIIYAREETDPLLMGSPTGPMGILNIDASVGYRAGGTVALDECTSIFGTYSRWDGQTSNSIAATPPNILNPVLLHPSTLTSGSTGIESSGSQYISFQTADIGYRRVHRIGSSSVINWTAGARYGNLEQQLNVNQTISVATGLTNLNSDIDFEGVGLLAGLDGERQNQCNGLLVYGKAFASFLGGTWKADVSQTNQFGGGVIANHYEDFRLSPVLEAELGGGWQSRCGRVRLTAGYLASGWFNSVSTRDYIQSFQENNFVDLIDTITFSGLTSRAELRW